MVHELVPIAIAVVVALIVSFALFSYMPKFIKQNDCGNIVGDTNGDGIENGDIFDVDETTGTIFDLTDVSNYDTFVPLSTTGQARAAMFASSPDSALIDDKITSMSIRLDRTSMLVTGTMTFNIRDDTDTVVKTLGTLDVSTLTVNPGVGEVKTFSFSEYTIQEDDRITVEFSSVVVGMNVPTTLMDGYDGNNTRAQQFTVISNWTDAGLGDLNMKLVGTSVTVTLVSPAETWSGDPGTNGWIAACKQTQLNFTITATIVGIILAFFVLAFILKFFTN